MCGRLRLEGQSKFTPINSPIHGKYLVGAPAGMSHFVWNGFARSDGSAKGKKSMAEQWDPKEWTPVLIRVDMFSEKDKSGKVHDFRSRRLGAIVSRKNGSLKLITRPARTEKERAIHHRMPSRVPSHMSIDDYVRNLNEHTGGNYQVAA